MNYLEYILDNELIKVLIVVISLDTIFGVLRAIKERKLNSTIGIDGMIRKVGMLICVFAIGIIDKIVSVNLIGFIPEEARTILNLKNVGINELFSILFIVFEILSVFKNAIKCELPIPKKLQQLLEKIMLEFTDEIKPEEREVYEKMVTSIAETAKDVYVNEIKKGE